MVPIYVIAAIALVACERVQGIDKINPVIGDDSYVAAHGRAPTDDDPFDERIRAHLAYAESRLRERDVADVPIDLREARVRMLDHLRDYWSAGVFPDGESDEGLLPTFVDGEGRRCAVAYLVEQTAGSDAMFAIDTRHHNDFIAQMDAPALVAWTERSGLTRDELAMIQPAYPPRPPKLHARIGAEYRHQLEEDTPALDTAMLTGSARLILPHNRWIGGGIVRLDGAVGRASNGDVAYDAHLRVGTGFAPMMWWLFHAGITAGIGVDAIGDAVPRAWTVPVELFWYVQTGELTRLGAFGGPTYALEDERSRGWTAGLDFVWTRDYEGHGALAPRAIHVTLGVQELADTHFAGLAISLATRSVLGYIPW